MQLSDLKHLDKENLLNHVGLQSLRSGAIPGAALFGLGILIGAGVGMLFAPKSGADLRHDLRGRVDDLKGRVGDFKERVGERVRGRAESMEEAIWVRRPTLAAQRKSPSER